MLGNRLRTIAHCVGLDGNKRQANFGRRFLRWLLAATLVRQPFVWELGVWELGVLSMGHLFAERLSAKRHSIARFGTGNFCRFGWFRQIFANMSSNASKTGSIKQTGRSLGLSEDCRFRGFDRSTFRRSVTNPDAGPFRSGAVAIECGSRRMNISDWNCYGSCCWFQSWVSFVW